MFVAKRATDHLIGCAVGYSIAHATEWVTYTVGLIRSILPFG
ncbi:hypothetical protein [Geminicoccus harenae]|nr:hypothetical protein [Geminicoccus harenae]